MTSLNLGRTFSGLAPHVLATYQQWWVPEKDWFVVFDNGMLAWLWYDQTGTNRHPSVWFEVDSSTIKEVP